MSIPSVLVPDPYQSSVADTVYAHKVAQPPLRSEWRVYPGNGNSGKPSGNTSIFNVFPPSNTTIVDRRMLLRLTVTVTATSTNGANPPVALAKSAQVSFRSFPVNTVVNQSNIVINGSGGFVTQNNDVMHPMKRFIGGDEKTWYQSPTMLDPLPDLTKLKPSDGTIGNADNMGLASPFYGVSTLDDVLVNSTYDFNVGTSREFSSRHGFPTSLTYDTASRTATYVLTEPLFSGVTGSASAETGYVNISKLDITVIYESDLKRMLSSYLVLGAENAANINAAPRVEITKAELLVHYITPSISTIPSVFTTGFKQYLLNSQSSNQALTGSAQTYVYNNLTLNTVPEFMYIYVKPPKSLITPATGEFTARISKISINLGTSFGHLSQMDEQTLYLMSKDNGFKAGDFPRWAKMGSVLCIDCAKDLGLIPGQNRYLPIDFEVTCSAFSQDPPAAALASVEICLLSVIPGTINIAPDQCSSYLGFTAQDQGNAQNDGKITQTVMVPEMTTGSGMGEHGGKLNWSGVWKGIKQGVKYAAPVLGQIASATGNPMLGKIAGAADMANNALNQGAGYKRRRVAGSGLLLG